VNSKDLVKFFHSRWKEKYKLNYPRAVNIKHCSMMHQLKELKYDDADILKMITVYLLDFDKDDFIAASGHTIENFRFSIPKIIAKINQELKIPRLKYHPDLIKVEKARKDEMPK